MVRKLLYIILGLSLLVNILLGAQLVFVKISETKIEQKIQAQQINEKTLAFTKLFVNKIMQVQSEISFEDRLELENNVRGLNDAEIFNQWQKFTKAKTNEEAQQNAGALLNLLLNKVSF